MVGWPYLLLLSRRLLVNSPTYHPLPPPKPTNPTHTPKKQNKTSVSPAGVPEAALRAEAPRVGGARGERAGHRQRLRLPRGPLPRQGRQDRRRRYALGIVRVDVLVGGWVIIPIQYTYRHTCDSTQSTPTHTPKKKTKQPPTPHTKYPPPPEKNTKTPTQPSAPPGSWAGRSWRRTPSPARSAAWPSTSSRAPTGPRRAWRVREEGRGCSGVGWGD